MISLLSDSFSQFACSQCLLIWGMENKTRDKSYKIIISKANISWRPLGRVLALPRDVSPSITCLRPILLQTNITQSHPSATKLLGSLFTIFWVKSYVMLKILIFRGFLTIIQPKVDQSSIFFYLIPHFGPKYNFFIL